MKIIDDLARGAVQSNKKDTLATRISILLAVAIFGVVVFLVSYMQKMTIRETTESIGDYHVAISEVDRSLYESLMGNETIDKVNFERMTSVDEKTIITEQNQVDFQKRGIEVIEGRNPETIEEVLVPKRYMTKHPDLSMGSTIPLGEKSYTIVGVYDDFRFFSFDETIIFAILEEPYRYQKGDQITAHIWYKNPRDTYPNTRELLQKNHIDEGNAREVGRLFYNTSLLEAKMIYPKGLIPPKHVLDLWVEKYGVYFLLTLLFAMMIYGSFNVWNNRDRRELALLKSAGMTEKQVKKLIRRKALYISWIPILLGTGLSFLLANLLNYLMYLNNLHSYEKMSEILQESLTQQNFCPIYPSLLPILTIICFAALTVYLSAMSPAKESAKLNILEGLNGISEKNLSVGSSKIDGNIEKTLAKDYYRAYGKSYRVILLVILMSAIIINFVTVSAGYEKVNDIYNTFKNPYPLTGTIFTEQELHPDFLKKMENLSGSEEVHIYGRQDFQFYQNDNSSFFSKEFQQSVSQNKKSTERLFASFIALSREDYQKVLRENGIGEDVKYILLNRTPRENQTPYSQREYIPLTDQEKQTVILRYADEGVTFPIDIGGVVESFPYDLDEQDARGTYIFTTEETLQDFYEKYGRDPGNPITSYYLRIMPGDNPYEVEKEVTEILNQYYAKSDFDISTEGVRKAMDREASRNMTYIIGGLQGVLLIIALSNAYNSFHGNLRARKRDFDLLSSAGMTDLQMNHMVKNEAHILLKKVLISYGILLIAAVFIRSLRSPYSTGFAVREIFLHINYLPMLLILVVIYIGIQRAMTSGMKEIEREFNIQGL